MRYFPSLPSVLLTLAALPNFVPAEEATKGQDLKKVADVTVELQSLSDKTLRPFSVHDGKANVVIFTTVDCPIANFYVPEIKKIAEDYQDKGISLYVVHCDPYLTPERAREHQKEYEYTLPIMLDLRHDLVRATGVRRTPEAVIVLPEGKIAYRGCVDDRFADLGKKRQSPRHQYLRQTLDEIVAGKPLTNPRTEVVGCIIEILPATRGGHSK